MRSELAKVLLEHAMSSGDDDQLEPVNRAAIAADLKAKLASLNVKHDFKVGDLVQYKSGLDNKKIPKGNVAIISKILPTPIIGDKGDSGSAYFKEALDVVVLEISSNNTATEYHLDSRRIEPYVEQVPQPLN